jgi:hypothetical protein
MAWMVAYLASPAGDFLSGCVITVDGARDNWFGTWPPSTATGESGEPDLPAPPTSIDPAANQRYCERPITGAFGKEMMVVVVETPAGRVDCDQASAVLVDYYAERPDPDPGSDPIAVAGFACNQVPYPDVPQVICADGDSLLYSMWRQGG